MQTKYFFDQDSTKPEPLSLRCMGLYETMSPGIIHRPNSTGDWLFMLFHDEVTIQLESKKARFEPGTLAIWSPDDQRIYGCPDKSWSHSWMHCDGPFITDVLDALELGYPKTYTLRDSNLFTTILKNLLTEMLYIQDRNETIICNTFESGFIGLQRSLQSAPPMTQAILQVQKYLSAHFTEPIALSDLSETFHLSQSHLCNLYKETFGVTIKQTIIKLRMKLAKFYHCHPMALEKLKYCR